MFIDNKNQDANSSINQEIDLLLESNQQQKQDENSTPKQQKSSTKAIPTNMANEYQNQIVDVLTAFIEQQNQNNAIQQQQLQRQKQIEIESKYRDRAGLAIAEFAKKMDDEIKRGEYIEWPYYNQADKTGAIVTLSVNGYSLVFLNGYTTAVPKSLKTEVDQYFKSFSNSRSSLSRIMVSSTNQLNGPVDTNATNEVINALNEHLPK